MRFTQITFRHMPRSATIGDRIRELSARLEDHHPEIERCRVSVEESGGLPAQRVYKVDVELRVAGGDIVCSADGPEIEPVLREAFGEAGRRLKLDAPEGGRVESEA